MHFLKRQGGISLSNLVKNELIKIFKKKTIYITMVIIFLLLIFMNCMFKYANSGSEYNYYLYNESYIESLKGELETLNPEKSSDVTTYINILSEIQLSEMMEQHKDAEWKLAIINERIAPYITERNTYQYGAEKNEEQVAAINQEIDDLLTKLDENDWKYFAREDLTKAEQQIEELNAQKEQTEDKAVLNNIETELKTAETEKEIAEIRLNKDIPYGTDYLNRAISTLQTANTNLANFKNVDELTYQEKSEYNSYLKDQAESRYILETGIDIQNTNSLKGILENFYSQFGIFLIVVVVMIAGTIVSEEFNKGTIKLLLVKPYTRNKILLSKAITTFIMIIFIIVITLIMQILIGGIIFGFDSLSEPVVAYNFNTNTMEEMNIFTNLGVQTLTQLPMIVLLATLAFAISTIFTNSTLAITISLLGFMSASIINQLAIGYDLQFMKYFVTMNWDLSMYLHGALPYMEGMNMTMSIIICVVYFLIMMIPTFMVFKKRNIKNI